MDDEDRSALWAGIVPRQFAHLINWLNPYHRTFGMSPDPAEWTTVELFLTFPKEFTNSSEVHGRMGSNHGSMGSGKRMSSVTSQQSYGSITSQASQVTSKRNVKVSITDCPKFLIKLKTG